MFWQKQKNSLKKYENQRKEKLSFFGFSVEFDWIFDVVLTLCLVLIVFYFSIVSLNKIKNYVPDDNESSVFLSEDKKVNSKIDEIIKEFSKNQKTITKQTATTTEEKILE